MMETEGARILFWRSLKLGFRYTTMVADGDSKAYDTVQEDQPYGPEYPILKEECINHVSKRYKPASIISTQQTNILDTSIALLVLTAGAFTSEALQRRTMFTNTKRGSTTLWTLSASTNI